MEKILNSNPEMWFFSLEHVMQPIPEKNESRQESAKKFDAFLEIRQRNSRELSETQKQQLIKLLLEPRNYIHPAAFSIRDNQNIGITVKTNDDSVTLFCGSASLLAYYKDKGGIEHVIFSAEGEKAFKHWRESLTQNDAAIITPPVP